MITTEQMYSIIDSQISNIAHMKADNLLNAEMVKSIGKIKNLSIFKRMRINFDIIRIAGSNVIRAEDTFVIIQNRFLHFYNNDTYGHLDFKTYCDKLRNDDVFTLNGFVDHIAFDMLSIFTKACKNGVPYLIEWINNQRLEQYDHDLLSMYINTYQYLQFTELLNRIDEYVADGTLIFDKKNEKEMH